MDSFFGAAECRDTDPSVFYPEISSGRARIINNEKRTLDHAQRTVAEKICKAKCRVVEECLEYALATRQDYGVWGGKTEEERYVMIKRRRSQVA